MYVLLVMFGVKYSSLFVIVTDLLRALQNIPHKLILQHFLMLTASPHAIIIIFR